MWGRIEKKYYVLVTCFTMYRAPSGEIRSFLLDSMILLNVNDPDVCQQDIDFFALDVIYLNMHLFLMVR